MVVTIRSMPSTGPIPFSLLPDSAAVGADGRLNIGGLDLIDLATEFGTPLFVYDEDQCERRPRGDRRVRPRSGRVRDESVLVPGHGAPRPRGGTAARRGDRRRDARCAGGRCACRSSGGPWQQQEHGGATPGVDARVHHIVVDSFDELDRLDVLHGEGLPVPSVQLRVTPGIEAHTHEFVRTGQDDSKFGFTASTGAAAAAVERAGRSPSMELIGLHCHIGSNVFAVDSFTAAAGVMAEVAATVRSADPDPRWRARGRVRRGRGGTDARPVGTRAAQGRRRARHHR